MGCRGVRRRRSSSSTRPAQDIAALQTGNQHAVLARRSRVLYEDPPEVNTHPSQVELVSQFEPNARAKHSTAETVTRYQRGALSTPPIPRPTGLCGSRLRTAAEGRGRRHGTNRPTSRQYILCDVRNPLTAQAAKAAKPGALGLCDVRSCRTCTPTPNEPLTGTLTPVELRSVSSAFLRPNLGNILTSPENVYTYSK